MTTLKRINGLHHYAYRCRNAEETRSFYEDLLGLPLAHVIQADSVPSTGASDPYVHLFFEFTDGSYIAFFDLDVVGVTDHEFVKSIYFFDPNGIRLEITCEVIGESERQNHRNAAAADLKTWTDTRPAPPTEFYRFKNETVDP